MLLSAPASFSKPITAETVSNRLDLYKSALKDPRVKALLDTISYAEGTSGPEGYRTMFTGKTFDTSQGWRHPDTVMRGGGYASTAAGRYQMLTPTYQMAAEATGTSGFSPAEQDLQAVYLIDNRRALEPLLRGENINTVINQLAPEWASLPTSAGKSAYGQPVRNISELQKYYQSRLDGGSGPLPMPTPLTAPPPVDGKPTDKPTVKNNAEFLQSYIGGGLGVTRALARPDAPKSIDVLGLLQSAFKTPKLME